MTARRALLEVKNLAYGTPDGRALVSGLSFTVDSGAIVAVVGPNGVGKSTLLQVVQGETAPTAGSIERAFELKHLRFLTQLQNREFHLPLTLRDVLSFSAGVPITDSRVRDVGLLDPRHLDLAWNTASGGERQKTLLTKILLDEPTFVVLDEPMNHLDADGRKLLRDALRRHVASDERGVLMVCHEQAIERDGWPGVVTIGLKPSAAAD